MVLLDKNFFLTKLETYLTKGLSRFDRGNFYGAFSCYGKCIFISDLLVDMFGYDFSLEKDKQSKYLLKLFDEFHSKLLEVIYG